MREGRDGSARTQAAMATAAGDDALVLTAGDGLRWFDTSWDLIFANRNPSLRSNPQSVGSSASASGVREKRAACVARSLSPSSQPESRSLRDSAPCAPLVLLVPRMIQQAHYNLPLHPPPDIYICHRDCAALVARSFSSSVDRWTPRRADLRRRRLSSKT